MLVLAWSACFGDAPDMRMTPEQVDAVEFRGERRGYNRDEVDNFLDEVKQELAWLNRQLGRLQSELGRLQQERDHAVAHAAWAEQQRIELDTAIGARIDAAVQRALTEADG
jgi:DivIVA domain-containing protein